MHKRNMCERSVILTLIVFYYAYVQEIDAQKTQSEDLGDPAQGKLDIWADGIYKLTDMLNKVNAELESVKKEIRLLKSDVKTDIAAVKTDVAAVKADVVIVKNWVSDYIPVWDSLKLPYPNTIARVFLRKSPAGHYKLTYDEAVALCQSEGMVIATKAQLRTALRLGMDECSWGWVEAGEAYFPTIWPRDGCGGRNRDLDMPDIVGPTSSSTYNVYCFK